MAGENPPPEHGPAPPASRVPGRTRSTRPQGPSSPSGFRDGLASTVPPGAWALGAGIVLVALILRPGATSTGPVLEELRAGVGMGSTAAAALSALPGLSFALSGAVAARLGHRLGAVGGLALACLLAAVGLLARAASGTAALFLLMSLVALLGAGLGNVLLPMAIKQHRPLSAGAWTAAYVTVMPVGSLLPQLLAPVAVSSGAGWRASLVVWGWVSLVAALPWLGILLAQAGRRRRAAPGGPHGDPARPHGAASGVGAGASSPAPSDPLAEVTGPGSRAPRPRQVGLADVARSPHARAMAVFFGLQSTQAYVAFGWLPQIFRDAGASLGQASLLLAAYSVWGLLGGLVVPPLVTRSRHLQAWVLLFVALLGLGYGGLLVAPLTAPWLWPCALGVSGFCFQVALVLVTHRTRDYRVTAALSGFTQSTGYVLACVGPFVIGWVHGLTGGWRVPLLLLLASALPMARAGWLACADGVIDDEIGADGEGRSGASAA